MKTVVISSGFRQEYKNKFPSDHDTRLGKLAAQGVYIFHEPQPYPLPSGDHNENAEGNVILPIFTREGKKKIELAPGERCVILLHGPCAGEEDPDLPLMTHIMPTGIPTFTIRLFPRCRLYQLIRTYLIEKAALEGKVVEEFHESIHGETNIPWRYEYFLEVSLRLQNLKSDENVAVVERIILGKEMPPRSYSGRGYFLYYKELPSIETDDDKAMVAEMARLVEEYMNASRRGAEVRGSDDLAAYKAICELLSLLSVEERKEFQMRVAGFMD